MPSNSFSRGDVVRHTSSAQEMVVGREDDGDVFMHSDSSPARVHPASELTLVRANNGYQHGTCRGDVVRERDITGENAKEIFVTSVSASEINGFCFTTDAWSEEPKWVLRSFYWTDVVLKEIAGQRTYEPAPNPLTREYRPHPGDIASIETVLRAGGYNVLSADDVIDHGGYVTVKNPDATKTYYSDLAAPTLTAINKGISAWNASAIIERRASRSLYYVAKPLRVTGFMRPGPNMVNRGYPLVRYSVGMRDGERKGVRQYISDGNKVSEDHLNSYDGDQTFREGAKYITLADMTPLERAYAQLMVVEGAYRSGALAYDRYDPLVAKARNNVDRLRGVATRTAARTPAAAGVILARDGTWQPEKWEKLQALNKRAGQLIREASSGGEADADDMAELLQEVSNQFGGYKASSMAAKWNELAPSDKQVALGECGHWHADDEGEATYDGQVCAECFSERYVHVVNTDDYRRRDTVFLHTNGDDDEDAEERYYTHRDPLTQPNGYEQGRISNWSAPTDALKHDRSFVVSPHGDFNMGIELEVVARDSDYRSTRVAEANKHFNDKRANYAMFKSDGSLPSGGFEIVTAAQRMGAHIKKFSEWEPKGLRSWDTGACGMHVHVDSAAFTPMSFGNFLMFYNDPKNAEFIKSIAGRHPSSDSGAARFAQSIHSSIVTSPVAVKKGDNSSRYYMVNLTNLSHAEANRLQVQSERQSKGSYSTLEIRIFRGTLRKARLLAQIEFAHASVVYCRTASWSKLNGDSFKEWLATTACYPHLSRWLGVNRQRNKNYLVAGVAATEAEV